MLAAGDAILRQCGAENIRHLLFEHHVGGGVENHRLTAELAHEDIPSVHHVVKFFHREEMPRSLKHALAAVDVNAVVERDHQRFRKIQEAHARAAVAPFSGHRNLDTPDCAVVIRVLFLHAEVEERRDDDLVAVERGHAESAADHLNAFLHELVAQPLVVANGEVRLRQMAARDGAQDQIAQRVHRVFSIHRLPADRHVLVKRAASGKARVRPGTNLVDGKGAQPEIFEQFACKFLTHALCAALFVKRVDILIHPPVGE
ncbi:hypothetical protein SDC9_137609 [bioreactor metagenome]|uniref:Uncharacterized protein n=1 Tax=bioreactor metagenome TaxID=1076179 RepID=A0A645DN10_9ZZZZ